MIENLETVRNNKENLFKPEFFFNELSAGIKINFKKKKLLNKDREKFFLKYIKKGALVTISSLNAWCLFSYNKKTKMLKSKRHILNLQKKIINCYKKNDLTVDI